MTRVIWQFDSSANILSVFRFTFASPSYHLRFTFAQERRWKHSKSTLKAIWSEGDCLWKTLKDSPNVNFSVFFFVDSKKVCIFVPDSGSPQGWAGQTLVVKKDVYERYLLSSDLANQTYKKIRSRNVHIGCIVPCSLFGASSLYLDVGYRVAYPCTRQCESPTMG